MTPPRYPTDRVAAYVHLHLGEVIAATLRDTAEGGARSSGA
jgi:hypothetical protein